MHFQTAREPHHLTVNALCDHFSIVCRDPALQEGECDAPVDDARGNGVRLPSITLELLCCGDPIAREGHKCNGVTIVSRSASSPRQIAAILEVVEIVGPQVVEVTLRPI